MNTSALSVVLAGSALLVSIALLIVHYRNQIERRHGELVQLRTQILASLSNLQQRLTSQLINAELVRLELRRLPEGTDKYEAIEQLPGVLTSISTQKSNVEVFVKKLEMAKFNRTAILLVFQEASAGFLKSALEAQGIEDKILSVLQNVRSRIKT